MEARDRRRFARHLVLEGVGLEGQRRLGEAVVRLGAVGAAGDVARAYVARAGVGEVLLEGGGVDEPRWVSEAVNEPTAREVLVGALEALEAIVGALEAPGSGS